MNHPAFLGDPHFRKPPSFCGTEVKTEQLGCAQCQGAKDLLPEKHRVGSVAECVEVEWTLDVAYHEHHLCWIAIVGSIGCCFPCCISSTSLVEYFQVRHVCDIFKGSEVHIEQTNLTSQRYVRFHTLREGNCDLSSWSSSSSLFIMM